MVITINGSNFEKDAIVIIGDDLALNIKVENSTFLTARTPPGQKAKRCICNKPCRFWAGSSKRRFEYMNPSSRPTISSVSPNQGTIYGVRHNNYGNRFPGWCHCDNRGNKARNVEVISPVKIRVITAGNTVKERNRNEYRCRISTLVSGFEYKAPETEPEIHDVTPAKGSAYGGTFVTIKGKNLFPAQG